MDSWLKSLAHPAGVVRKLYHVVLDKIIPAADLETIAKGVQLGDEFIEIDDIAYANNAEDKREVGIAIHSGQNRVVRRIFESFGYSYQTRSRNVCRSDERNPSPWSMESPCPWRG